jgi:putative protease
MYVKKQDNPIPLNWDAETIVTNYFQCNYWGGKGAKANTALLAPFPPQ